MPVRSLLKAANQRLGLTSALAFAEEQDLTGEIMKNIFAIVLFLFFIATTASRTKSQEKPNPCNENMTFCWYGEEVQAWGNSWVAQDQTEKPLNISLEIRCIKKFGICALAAAQLVMGNKIVTKVDILPITHWDTNQITADGENPSKDPCEKDSYILNRVDRAVLYISSPGPKSDFTPVCKGKPKTVVYKLSRD